ncbi:hypothetical protein HGRIS_001881 [Hohenbuehelia grisea]|uniref:rRNA-processing protein EFG1 n=1 Tax=Hohenbuehelia grisea TaxID=104357 RepID=A0ABR3JIQ3_9AGAR
MGPTRTTKSSTHHKPSPGHSKHDRNAVKPSTTPGVQKLKASLRQTRRLLAKVSTTQLVRWKSTGITLLVQDKLAADVRVATERKLKSLEADLAKAELVKQERTLATRYHKVKFFGAYGASASTSSIHNQFSLERQKVVRKINQTKKQISSTSKTKELKGLETKLANLRVDLNYITVRLPLTSLQAYPNAVDSTILKLRNTSLFSLQKFARAKSNPLPPRPLHHPQIPKGRRYGPGSASRWRRGSYLRSQNCTSIRGSIRPRHQVHVLARTPGRTRNQRLRRPRRVVGKPVQTLQLRRTPSLERKMVQKVQTKVKEKRMRECSRSDLF